MPDTESSSIRWADVAVFPLVAILSIPPLLWFGHHSWSIIHTDAPRYLLAASQLVAGYGFEIPNGVSNYNGGHGPVFPALIGALIIVFGRHTQTLAWALRLLALLNSLLAYFLAKRLSGPLAGLLAAALLALFDFNVSAANAFDIDAVLLTLYLSALLALLSATKRSSSGLALLSGVLLGASILTKETAIASLPLALVAVLLVDWELRGALWHYVGVAAACLPWWVWAYSARGEVYLLDRLPGSLRVPVAVGAVLVGFGVAVIYATGRLDRLLAGEGRRRWTGWFVALAWTISLSAAALATGSHLQSGVSIGSVGAYLARLLAPSAIGVPAVVMVVGYLVWRAFGRDGAWRLLALALLFQVPVCLLVVVEEWAKRQFLVPQVLLLCALSALVVDPLAVALGEAASSHSAYPIRLASAVVAASLAVLLLTLFVDRVQTLLPDGRGAPLRQHRVAPQATAMVAWMDRNVPTGERVLVDATQGEYIAYLDGGRHEWTFLRLDQGICAPRPNTQTRCDPNQNAISRIPSDAAWVQIIGRCKVVSLSMPSLLEQVHQSGSDYVMITGSSVFPGIMGLASLLEKSGAFEAVHSEGKSGIQGAVLLKSTGRAPEAVPALLNRNAVLNLGHCEQARGQQYSRWSRSKFPNGIFEVTVSH